MSKVTTRELSVALLEDGTLQLTAEAGTAAQVRHWLPRLGSAGAHTPGGVAEVEVVLQDERSAVPPSVPLQAPSGDPVMRLGPIEAWSAASGARITFFARDRSVTGEVDLAGMRATIAVSGEAARPVAAPDEPRHPAVYSALTLTAALLLNRMRRALLHAAAVVASDGRAWLLVGDAFAGKTTTTVQLIRSGWGWVSDDHVILSRAPDGTVRVEGWPRDFHLDRGYLDGVSTGERDTVDPATLGPGRWQRSAPLAGVLFPHVIADEPTMSAPLSAGDALALLIRQSPWLLADPDVAKDILALLTDAIAQDTYHLRLGSDSLEDPARLIAALPAGVG